MLGNMARNLKVFTSSQRYMWLSFFAYRFQAYVWLAVVGGSIASTVVSITLIYTVSGGITGWSYFQLMALAALSNMAFAVASYLLNPWTLVMNMRNGVFDQVLTKPYNTILLTLSRSGWVGNASVFLSGVVLFVYSLTQVQVTALALVASLAVFAVGCLAFTMFLVFMAMLSYVLLRSANYLNWLSNIAQHASEYPIWVYGIAGMMLLTVALPIGLASYYPAQLMFLKTDYTTALMAVAIGLGLSYAFYRSSYWLLKFYTSGGG